ncbi:uncharacterized protein METZ01_LOCUS415412, partial [marine metagenome]
PRASSRPRSRLRSRRKNPVRRRLHPHRHRRQGAL